DFGHHSKADPSFGQYHWREVERDTEFFETDRLDALSDAAGRRRLAGHPGRNWKFAARNKCRRLTGDCRQIRLRQRSHYPGVFHRPYGGLYRGSSTERSLREVARDQRAAEGRERVVIVEIHDGRAVIQACRKVDAKLLDDRARDLGDRNLEHHLIAATDRDRVDDLVDPAHQAAGKIARLLRLYRARRRAG